MKILSYHIENFGKISNKDASFTEGLNTICEENGWGKSTLASFIRVMFFGPENDSARKDTYLIADRKHYKPWQGGVFGGSLVFETKGKKYRIVRRFGEKAAEDVFELYDENTGLVSGDFTSNIGLELFGVDSETFKRTIFINQNEVETSASNDIQGKIGNLTDNTDDMGNYDKAKENLKAGMNKLKSGRSLGRINELKADISELEMEIKSGASKEEALAYSISEKEKLLKEKEAKISEKTDLNLRLQEEAVKEVKIKLLAQYEELENEVELRKNALDKAKAVFVKRIPSQEELDRCLERNEKLIAAIATEAKLKLSEEENKLAQRIIVEKNWREEIDNLEERWKKKRNLEIESDRLENECREKEKEAESLENSRKKKDNQSKLGLFLGLGCIAVAVVLFVTLKTIIAAFVGVIGFGLVISMLFVATGSKKKKFLADSRDLRNEVSKAFSERAVYEEEISSINEELRKFFKRVNYVFDDYTAGSDLQKIKHDMEAAEKASEKASELMKCSKERNEHDSFIRTFFLGIGIDYELSENNYSGSLRYVNEMLRSYSVCEEEYKKAHDEKLKFAEREKIEDIKKETLYTDVNVEEIKQKINEDEERIDELSNKINSLVLTVGKYYEEVEAIDEKKESLEKKRAEISECEKEYGLMEKASKLLTIAKENLTNRYVAPVKASFKKYASEISLKEITDNDFVIDANADLSLEKDGGRRKPEQFSAGLKDVYGVALRMAYADAMFKDEKPFVIMDDPFVNLDGNNLNGGLNFLENIAKDHQVIYMTCHESRKR